MIKRSAILVTIAFALTSFVTAAQENNESERIARDVCANCHGKDGNSTSPLFPRLAGQRADYLVTQLKAFRDRTRADPHARAFMWGMAQSLSESTINGLATYYSRQAPVASGRVDSTLATKGKEIYENGVESQGVPACATCHGEKGEGTELAPRLAGQHSTYLIKQMDAFRSMLRENEIMHENTKNIDNDQITAVGAYLGSK